MTRKPFNIYQFKITLDNIKPAIWRSIQVPESYSFWDLHVAIQDAMGWEDEHLHQFEIANPQYRKEDIIGIPDEDFEDEEILPEWKIPIKNYFSRINMKASYDYDFGDGWCHTILLEKILAADPTLLYPLCIAGQRACPPEDCGGPHGYQNLLNILNDPTQEEYEDRLEWVGDDFDSEKFSVDDVQFEDPKERVEITFDS